ncbi:MAG: QueT transporter family protein [Clostridia bacterium]
MKKNNSVHFLAQSAVIAAMYAVLTYVAAMMNLAYGSVQFRFSEALTILPVFTPAAIPGLTIGCFLANLTSPLGPVDWIFGSLATLLATLLTRALKDITFKGIPLLSFFAPVLINAIIIGLEIACLSDVGTFMPSLMSLTVFLPVALSVGIGEFVICYGLGVPLFLAIKKSKLEKFLNS